MEQLGKRLSGIIEAGNRAREIRQRTWSPEDLAELDKSLSKPLQGKMDVMYSESLRQAREELWREEQEYLRQQQEQAQE